jgi:hypothetical protein
MENQLIENAEGAEVVADTVDTTDGAPAEKPEFNADDIKKVYFNSTQMAEAQTAINAAVEIATGLGLEQVMNFDGEKEFPEGYGIALIPIAKRINNVNVTLGVAISAVPDLATVQAHEGGNAFIMDSVVGSMIAKLANAVRPRGDAGETAASIPYSVEDFITSNRPEGVLLGFRTFAGAYVKVLKKKGLKFITESILRQALQSAAFAEQQFPSIPQDKWIAIIDSMMARAVAAGVAVGMLEDWKASRDSAELKDTDIDLSDLDFDDTGEVAKVEAAPIAIG